MNVSLFLASNSEIASEARAVAGSRPFRIWPGADGNGTSLSYFLKTIPTKLFRKPAELGIISHLPNAQRTRSTYRARRVVEPNRWPCGTIFLDSDDGVWA